MASRELTAFADYVRTHVGTSDTNQAPLQGILDAYGLTGMERDDMLRQLHEIGAVTVMHIDSPLLLDKLP